MTEIITRNLAKDLLPKRNENSNKGDFGKVLNIVSSEKYFGAGFLAATAALRTGAGYSIFCTCDKVIEKCKLSPNLIYKSHKNFDINIVKNIIIKENISSVVFGCGIDINKKTIKFTKELLAFLKTTNIPTVIDADGLNCLAQLKDIKLNSNFILTPHPKELSRLINVSVEEIENNREHFIKSAQNKYQAIVILKGHRTLITTKTLTIYENRTGNTALAKGGSGDILSGMLGGFLAQKVSTERASILAVYLHGLAGEIYSGKYSEYSLLPEELLEYTAVAISQLCH